MAEKLEDLNLPNMSVMRIIKEALPENINVGKDARSALSRAASVFVLYVTSQASNEAQKDNRKTLLGKDILSALSELEFEHFIQSLEEAVEEYKIEKAKKSVKTKKSEDGVENTSAETEDVNEVIELMDDE